MHRWRTTVLEQSRSALKVQAWMFISAALGQGNHRGQAYRCGIGERRVPSMRQET